MYGLITVIHVSTNRTEILRQFLDAIIKRVVVVFEVEFHIPSVVPQSQQVDRNI